MKLRSLLFSVLSLAVISGCSNHETSRSEVSLNGTWDIAVTGRVSEFPSEYKSKIQVPGLVDMASPAVDSQDTVYENKVYWYRRTFSTDGHRSDVVQLKINKSCYHTRVFVNGKPAGENVYSFTPSVIDIKPFLNKKGEDNELVIAVGCRNNLPDTVTNGWDFEKIKYIPGIYDDVKIIQSDLPFISNIQIVPDIDNKQIRVVAELLATKKSRAGLKYTVRESVSRLITARGWVRKRIGGKDPASLVDIIIPLEGVKLWSPETPFLYELELATSGDNVKARFGMRSFKAGIGQGVFLLNGKPYYMRGTNVCIYRFFEDPERGGLPWDSEWVTRLHSRFKDMYWNSIRYCIGFPPERWYEIADSLGFLIQDEYPLWTLGRENFKKYLGNLSSDQLASEYREWMRERWNHPCVVIWDAQNESMTDTTGKAVIKIRDLDLSSRPWDNGWAVPVSETDAIESHPYLFSRYQSRKPSKEGYLWELLNERRIPGNDPNSHYPLPGGKRYENPVILNEYGWIWLNRDGSTTTLTDNVYKNVFPDADTPDKRMEVYARNLAMLTEYWRSGRNAAAVMHFCGLGYSRPEKPRGQTSDHFTDLVNLEFEPNFYKYVKQAFSPVGAMTEFWDSSVKREQTDTIPVHIINDTYDSFSDTLRVYIHRGTQVFFQGSFPFTLDGLAKKIVNVPVIFPAERGDYSLEAGIIYKGEPVISKREFKII